MKKVLINYFHRVVRFAKRYRITYFVLVAVRSIAEHNSSDLYDLLQGFYEPNDRCATFRVDHNGSEYPEDTVYSIEFGCGDKLETKGFFAILRWQLAYFSIADRFNMKPIVYWGENMAYWDQSKSSQEHIHNAYEYYFESVSDIPYNVVKSCKNVIQARPSHFNLVNSMSDDKVYLLDDKEIAGLGELYKKHVRLNAETARYIDQYIKCVVAGKKLLGVHVRGTDFKQGFAFHPSVIEPEEYLEKTVELLNRDDYDGVFLATDDKNVLKLFLDNLGDKVLYYHDVFRGEKDTAPMFINDERPFHKYNVGREVLRDVYTLAYCDSLVAGLSHVSFAARFISASLGRTYNRMEILSKGINIK